MSNSNPPPGRTVEEELIDLLERHMVPQLFIARILDELDVWIANTDALAQAKINAKHQSKLHSCVQHVNQLPDGQLQLSDWSDSSTIASFENGREL